MNVSVTTIMMVMIVVTGMIVVSTSHYFLPFVITFLEVKIQLPRKSFFALFLAGQFITQFL